MREDLISALETNQQAFGIELSNAAFDRLADYYDLIREYNALLHLVAPCSPEEFAVRHVLESLTLLEHLPPRAKFADVGAGAGLPSIPCLLVREDLKAMLVESKEKKSKFLETAANKLGIAGRAKIINRQFEETEPGNAEHVTCRALDKFTEKLPRLIKWSGKRKLLLFGGPNLRAALETNTKKFHERLMPLSEKRFLFVVQ
jgi:16S rRNA (guanine527-N7)-methyltransferase